MVLTFVGYRFTKPSKPGTLRGIDMGRLTQQGLYSKEGVTADAAALLPAPAIQWVERY